MVYTETRLKYGLLDIDLFVRCMTFNTTINDKTKKINNRIKNLTIVINNVANSSEAVRFKRHGEILL